MVSYLMLSCNTGKISKDHEILIQNLKIGKEWDTKKWGTFQLCAENQLRATEGACCRSTSTEEVRDLSYFKRMIVPQVVVGKWMADVYFDGYYLVIEN